MRDAHPFAPRAASGLEELAAKDKLGSVPFHTVLHRVGHIAVHGAEDLLAALDHGDLRPEGTMIVRHFEGDGPGAQDEKRLRGMRVVEDVIADQWRGFGQSGNVRMADDRTGGDKDAAGGDGLFPALAEAHD